MEGGGREGGRGGDRCGSCSGTRKFRSGGPTALLALADGGGALVDATYDGRELGVRELGIRAMPLRHVSLLVPQRLDGTGALAVVSSRYTLRAQVHPAVTSQALPLVPRPFFSRRQSGDAYRRLTGFRSLCLPSCETAGLSLIIAVG